MLRRLAIAAILAISLGAPIAELFDSWDQALPTGSDTEANVAVVALCIGVAFAIGTIIIVNRIRPLASASAVRVILLAIATMMSASVIAGAQTTEHPDAVALFPAVPPVAPPVFSPDAVDTAIAQQPAGPPPTPRHTGIKALTKHLVTNFKYLPSKENLLWAGAGGGLALAVHPFDDNVNHALVGNDTAEKIFKSGELLGELGTLLGSASAVYAVGRIRDEPRLSHVGMDLIEAMAMSEALTQTLKYTVRRERPDRSSKNSFPSGHAADTFAFATALERHLNWHYSVPAYIFASYVAISRLPANRHWLSDAVFGSAVGIIAGRTVTSHESERPYPVAVTVIPGGVAVMYVRNK